MCVYKYTQTSYFKFVTYRQQYLSQLELSLNQGQNTFNNIVSRITYFKTKSTAKA